MRVKVWANLAHIPAILAILFPSGVALGQPGSCAARVDSASTALDSAIVAAMRDHGVPGTALSVVHDGQVVYVAGYGCANVGRGIAVDPRRTVFHVASVSKQFTAMAIMLLARDGVT